MQTQEDFPSETDLENVQRLILETHRLNKIPNGLMVSAMINISISMLVERGMSEKTTEKLLKVLRKGATECKGDASTMPDWRARFTEMKR